MEKLKFRICQYCGKYTIQISNELGEFEKVLYTDGNYRFINILNPNQSIFLSEDFKDSIGIFSYLPKVEVFADLEQAKSYLNNLSYKPVYF